MQAQQLHDHGIPRQLHTFCKTKSMSQTRHVVTQPLMTHICYLHPHVLEPDADRAHDTDDGTKRRVREISCHVRWLRSVKLFSKNIDIIFLMILRSYTHNRVYHEEGWFWVETGSAPVLPF